MIIGVRPVQDLASLAVHDALAQYGRALVTTADAVAALRALEAGAAKIPTVDPRLHPHVADWARFVRLELTAWAAAVNAHLAPPDRYGRDVFGWRASTRVLHGGASRSTASVWQRLHDAAFARLFHDDDGPGLLVLDVTGPRHRVGRVFVGLRPWQRDLLLRREICYIHGRQTRDLTLAGLVLNLAEQVVTRRWEKSGLASELLENALNHKLNLLALAVDDLIKRSLVGGTDVLTAMGRSYEIDQKTGRRKAVYRPRVRLVSLDAPRLDDEGDTLHTLHDYVEDPSAAVAAKRVEDRAHIRAAIKQGALTPIIRLRLQQMLDAYAAGATTAKDLAQAMTAAAGQNISKHYVKKLKGYARGSIPFGDLAALKKA